MNPYDLIVVGGGPAGTAAAITAARYGARVLLLEQGRFPRHKVCGEFVSAESLELLAGLLNSREPARQVLQHIPRIGRGRLLIDGKVLESPVQPPAASISRFELDAALWQAADNLGVDARDRHAVRAIARNRHFLVSTSTEMFEARAVINASGRWSNLKHSDTENPWPAKWLGLKAHFSESTSASSVDLYFFEGGYCGVQPVKMSGNDAESRINVCAMVHADVACSLEEVFACHLALRERSSSWQRLTDPVATSPLKFGTPSPEYDRVLMVGDAAGFVDPFIGDGISLALRSGNLAAQSLRNFLRGQASLEQAMSSYCEAYRQQLMPVFRTSAKIRALFGLPKPLRAGLLHLFGNVPALTGYLFRKTRPVSPAVG
ncbi:MAG: hypothetical protein DMG70_10210 [Acidobacteria bacterium]|nr:MAG: hypothetical protein DMG70_10210 [Acidobacteriota bacterium]